MSDLVAAATRNIAKLGALCGQSFAGIAEIETGPGGSQIQVLDPDGNPIELFEPAAR